MAEAPGTFDPASAIDESALLITRHLYEGLVTYAPGTTRVIPALAESWGVSADGLTWTFHLRHGVQFSDGVVFTADAAGRNLQRWLDGGPPGSFVFWRLMFGGFAGEVGADGRRLSVLAGVTSPDPGTLTLTLHRPDASLLNTLAMPSFAFVSPALLDAWKAGGEVTRASAGTGPFMLEEWSGDGLVRLVRNPDYWGAPPSDSGQSGGLGADRAALGPPDELIFKVIPDDTQRLLALRAGEIVGMARLNPRDYAAASGQASGVRVDFNPALNVLYLGFNQAREPWNHRDCRLAVAYALNKPRYVQEFFPGDAEVAVAMQPPAVWGYDASPGDRLYDPEQARQRWQACLDARVTVPVTITLFVPPLERPYLPDPVALGAAIQSDLAAIGVQVQIASPEWQTLWLPEVHAGRADLFLLGWVGVNGDPDSFLCPLFCGAEAAFNSDPDGLPLPPDPELAALLKSARNVSDPVAREALYRQVHTRIFEGVPAIPLAHRKTAWAFRTEVRGNIPSPIEDIFFNLRRQP